MNTKNRNAGSKCSGYISPALETVLLVSETAIMAVSFIPYVNSQNNGIEGYTQADNDFDNFWI